MQDKVILNAESARIQHGFPGIENLRIVRNAPGFVADHRIAEFAGGVGSVAIAMEQWFDCAVGMALSLVTGCGVHDPRRNCRHTRSGAFGKWRRTYDQRVHWE